jgi:ABC-type oligopeptide transport system substrate-binding subunit
MWALFRHLASRADMAENNPMLFRLLFVLCFFALPALAGEHAIAMTGSPKYGPDFVHLDYANPDAPKGGALRLAMTAVLTA